MTKYIRQSEYHQGLFNLKTTCRLFEPNDIHYAYDLYKKITNFIEETVINDGAQDEEEWETYVFENYPGFDKMMEYTERFLDLYGIIGIDEDKIIIIITRVLVMMITKTTSIISKLI